MPGEKDISIESDEEDIYDDPVKRTQDMLNPILFVRNVPADSFYLILSGIVMVCSGSEGFLVELGPFNFLGLDALTSAALTDEDNRPQYMPDFSAKVINKARLLKIKRSHFQRLVSVRNPRIIRQLSASVLHT